MFTTLLDQLYPPLKGFSQDQAHTYTYGLCSFQKLLQGDQLYPPLKGFSQDQAHTYTYGLCSFQKLLQGVSLLK